MHRQVDTFTASGTWTCPSGVTSIDVECWAAGGGGLSDTGGGGGGAYSKKNSVSVTPTNNYTVTVGTSAVDTNGGDTSFESSCIAKGGLSRTNGGTGGTAAGSTGDTKFSGGSGSAGTANRAGGGGAGEIEAGGNASGTTSNGGDYSGARGTTSTGSAPAAGGASATGSATAGARGEVRISYDITPTLGFPYVTGRSFGRSAAAATSHTINMPSGIVAGDLLLILFAVDGSPTCSISSGGWTKLGQASNSTIVTQAIFYKVAAGSDTATVDTDASEENSHCVLLIKNASGLVSGTSTTGTSTNANPPSHTPTASRKFLWIATAAIDNNSSMNISAAPSSYSDHITTPGRVTTGANLVSADRFLEASSENPGAFTSSSEEWVAWTLSVFPSISLTLDQGAFALTGQTLLFLYHRVMSLLHATFSVSGQNVILTKTYLAILDFGSYLLSGIDVVLRFVGWTDQNKNSSTFANESKNSSTFSNESKSSSSWNNQSKS